MNLMIAVPGDWARVSARVGLSLEQQEDRRGADNSREELDSGERLPNWTQFSTFSRRANDRDLIEVD